MIDLRERSRRDHYTNLQADLHGAAARGEMRLDYHPIVHSVGREIAGFEALLRWDHPHAGLIMPETLIPLAEQSHVIGELGRWVLRQACSDHHRLEAWRSPRSTRSTTPGLLLSVSVSPKELLRPGFCDGVQRALGSVGTEPSNLALEITEGTYVEDSARALTVLEDLKELGVVIALGDFGTGYSSLTRLQEFPIDMVKIGRRFVNGLGKDPASAIVIRSVIDLAHSLGMEVIAGGIERSEQHDLLTEFGCDMCQGHYFSQPMNAEALHWELRLE